jgi:hypothetical protein
MTISGNTLLPQTALIYPPFADTSYNQYTNVLLIDNTTPSYQTFVDSANNDTFPVVYSKDCSGTELLELLRNMFTIIPRIGFVFVSQGNQSVTFLDNMPLFHTDNYTLFYDGLPSKDNGLVAEPYSKNVDLVLTMIREFSIINVDFLACNTLNYSVWKTYYDFLTQSTGVIVGASDNKTGNIKYGGDWILESTSQDIELVYFTKLIEYYQYLLDTPFATMNQISYIYSGVNSGNYLYYNNSTGSVSGSGIVRVNLTNPTDISYSWGHIAVITTALATDGTYLYGINATNSSIFKINLTNTADKNATFTPANTIGSINTQIGGGIYYYSNTLYVSDYVNKRILSINTGNAYTTTFLNLTLSPYLGIQSSVLGALFIYSGNLYVNTNNSGTNLDGIMARFSMTNLTDFTYPFKIKNINMGINWVNNGYSETYALNSATGDLYGYTLDRSWIYKVNLNTYDACMNWYAGSPGIRTGYALTLADSYLYNLTQYGSAPYLYKIPTILPTSPNPTIQYDKGNTYTVALGNLQVSFTDASNSTNNVYYQYSITRFNGNVFANASVFSTGTNAFRYYITGLNALTDISYSLNMTVRNSIGNSAVQSTSVIIYTTPTAITNSTISTGSIGNINVSVTETMPSTYYYLNNVSYMYYLYITGTNQSSNILAYTVGANLTSTSYTTNFTIPNISPNRYRVFLISRNSVGNTLSTPFSANVTIYDVPFPTVYFDAVNTKTVASGNLQVRITDLSNTSLNDVYYQYALNYNVDASFANTFVKVNVSPYTFFIPSITDISNTIYVRASNPLGNSSPAANLQVTVYQTPRAPPQVSFTLVGSGNVQVSINELASQPVPYYYLNNVSYYLYAYNNFGENNLSGNTSLSVYNIPVGILANTNTSYGNIVSYVNTGLNANTYTMYVIARNTVGNSNPISANIAVLFTPSAPSIDTGNTKSLTSGNLTISVNDTVNSTNNQVYYFYTLDGTNYGNSGVVNNGNTNYKFTVKDTGNAFIPLVANTYTLYIKASNTVGNATSTSYSVQVYTTPVSPIIDISNTQSLSSGNLTVSIIDSSNSPTNGIYYLYSMDGITYGNSRVAKTTNTTYSFTINNTGNAQIPLIAKTYTLYIAAANPIGNTTSTPATATEIVYTTPSPPTINQGNTKSITSGNLNVGFTDTFNNGNNQVEYTYFLYDSTAPSLFYV